MSSGMNALSAAVASEEANERVSTERAAKFVPAGDAAAVKSEEATDETLTSTSSSPSANTPAATEPKSEETTAAAAAVQPSIGVDDDSDSDIEDVTDQYVQKPRATSPEIIEVEDVTSDEEDCKREGGGRDGDASSRSNNNIKNSNIDNAKRSESDLDDEAEESSSEDEDDLSDSNSQSSDSSIEDVTEFMLAKKCEQMMKQMSDAVELPSDDEDDTNTKAGMKRRRRTTTSPAKRRKWKKPTESPIEVVIADEDMPMMPGQKATGDDDKNDSSANDSLNPNNEVEHSIKQRIIKLLNTGYHNESNENEARNAMKLARRLMERYNLDQAVLLQERGDGSLNDFSTANGDDGTFLRGGIVTANIRNRKKGTALTSLPRWNDFLVQPVCANFRVEAFKSVGRRTQCREAECSITFYGIRTNAQLAAYAFKIASERIALMAASYDAAHPQIKRTGVSNGKSGTRTVRLSYAMGIVIGLDRDVKEGLRKEEARRKSKLNKARKAAARGESYHEDDGDSVVDVVDVDEGDENEQAVSLGVLERENSAQVALVDHQKKIAEDVLKVSLMVAGCLFYFFRVFAHTCITHFARCVVKEYQGPEGSKA